MKKAAVKQAKSFKISDQEYNDFVNYLSDKNYDYSTRTEKILAELKTEAEKENKLPEVKTEYEAFKSKLSFSKKNDLSQFKDEIKRILENEIAGRYFYQKGRIEHGFQYDEELKSAYKVLESKSMLANILQGEGSYKSIGKPEHGFSASLGK